MKNKRDNPVALLLKWAGRDKIYLIASVACAFIGGLFTIGAYIGIYQLMTAILSGTCTIEIVTGNAILITVTTIIRQIFQGASGVLSHKGAYGALFHVRCMITEHLAKVSLGALDERRSGDIKTVLNEDIEKLELCLAHNIPELVSFLTGPVVIFVYLMTVNVPLALISLVPLPVVFLIMGAVFKYMSGVLPRVSKSLANFNSVIIEYISGMKLIKAYNMGSKSFRKFSDAIEEENKVWNQISKRTAPPYAAFIIILECGMLLMVPIGGMFFLNGSITSSIFLLFAYIGSLYLAEILPLQQLSMDFAQSLNGVAKAKGILNLPIYQGGGDFPKQCDIEMRNVRFSYDGKVNVLENCSLHVSDGEKIALVGASGTGKSTIIELISRFYDVQEGEILIGGKNIKDINYEKLLENTSIVFQKAFLTRDSVLENIRMGGDATLEKVRAAAKEAQIDDFIMSLPDGYDTKVGSFGSRFSGGEKQRLAIARAILKNAPILILDEATSAADPENQVEIDKAIENLCCGKTVIIVAHRLGAVKMCDKAAVVENHTITACGSHAEVLKTNHYYQKVWKDYQSARDVAYALKGAESIER
ncbi:ATP-binding cassette, subfamily B [Sporobacter termitidis DSM 10068]|uniref:ATP-binding cassette, subfamily B n=1 Tax=Sporobacter termitidis DSM 10068 TaxID=1123282 RepID=A0A1M5W555_9FIRM|nr:ABC transporter ATP-binding protein [Sporobacter termitidis]SHH82616.1 ATP-binding cassette, subfamily B [Sporobacter termitidis DSM 10068]